MKFKKDELTFSDIIQARDLICGYRDADKKPCRSICPAVYPENCKLAQYYKQKHLNIDDCYDFCVNNPRMAAEIMGFEVIDDGTPQKEKNPFHDIGSMTLAHAKEYCFQWRHSHQAPCEKTGCELRRRHICMDCVHEWDFDRLTPEELEICKALGAKWITRSLESEHFCSLWSIKPSFDKIESHYFTGVEGYVATISSNKFPSVKPGDCINVEEMIGGIKNA